MLIGVFFTSFTFPWQLNCMEFRVLLALSLLNIFWTRSPHIWLKPPRRRNKEHNVDIRFGRCPIIWLSFFYTNCIPVDSIHTFPLTLQNFTYCWVPDCLIYVIFTNTIGKRFSYLGILHALHVFIRRRSNLFIALLKVCCNFNFASNTKRKILITHTFQTYKFRYVEISRCTVYHIYRLVKSFDVRPI